MKELQPGDLIERKAIEIRGVVAREIMIPCRFVKWYNKQKGECVVEYQRIGTLWPYQDTHPEGSQEVLRPEEYLS